MHVNARRIAGFILVTGWLIGTRTAHADDTETLAIKTGDLVVFFGDQTTEEPDRQRSRTATYPQLVESFLTARYPDLRIRYRNVGWSDDTLARALLRLERDVLSLDPTVIVLCFGMNDAGYLPYDEVRLERFRTDLAQLITRCRDAGARCWLLSPPAVDEDRGRRLRVTRDGRGAVVDLAAIQYNEVLERYVETARQAAESTGCAFVDWFSACRTAAEDRTYSPHSLTLDGHTPSFRSAALAATLLLRSLGADPIRIEIELDWNAPNARVSTHTGETSVVPILVTEAGERILTVENLPMVWPMPGGRVGALSEAPEAADMCTLTLRMKNPPGLGVELIHDSTRGENRPVAITPGQLEAGFNLASTYPLRTLAGALDLHGLIQAKNATWQTVWRRLRLSTPDYPELVDAHEQLIRGWTSYVEGYEKVIFRYPRTFGAKFMLTESSQQERLPTSRPTTPRRSTPLTTQPSADDENAASTAPAMP